MVSLLSFPGFMEMTAVLLYVVSMMMTTDFNVEYYYPFFRGTGITTQEQVTVERHADKDAFSAACDDLRIGITLIFYLQNAAEYMK